MQKKYKLIYILLAIILFVIIFSAYNNIELWFDELWTVKAIGRDKSLLDTIKIFCTYDIYNLPLYFIIAYIFYHGLFFSKISLFLPGIIFAIIGLIFLVKIIKNLFDTKTSIIIAAFTILSSTFISNILLEVRCYGQLFMLSVLFLYFYLKRYNDTSKKNIIILGIIGVGLMYTHWFGSLLMFFYFICDLFFCIKKKIEKNILISYLIMLVSFFPWIIMIIMYKFEWVNLLEFWPEIPKLSDVILIINYMMGVDNSKKLAIIVFFISCILIIIRKNKDKKDNFNIFLHSIFLMISIILSVYIYSAYINRNCSLFVERYFIVILPQFYIILAYFIWFIFSDKVIKSKIRLVVSILICIVLSVFIINNIKSGYVHFGNSYKKMADYLYSNKDIYNDNTLLIAGENLYYIGLFEFYFENKKLPVPNNYVSYSYVTYLLENKSDDFQINDYEIIYFLDFNNLTQIENVLNKNFMLFDSHDEINVYKYKKVK